MRKNLKNTVAALGMGVLVIGSLAACGSNNSQKETTAKSDATAAVAASESGKTDDVDWPKQSITIEIGFSAGSGTDLGARLLADPLAKELGQPVVVENKPGSGSWIAWNDVIKNAKPDGYTMSVINHNFAVGQYDPDTPREYGLDDVTLLASQCIDPNVMAIRSDETRFTDFKSFVDYATKNDVMVAVQSAGITDGDATMCEWLIKNLGCKINFIPVDSASDGRTMFLAGDADVYFASVGDVYTYVNDGTMKAVVLFNDKPSPFLPDLPSIYDLGYDKAISAYSVRGYFVPKGTDQAIVDKLTNAIQKCFEDPDYQKKLADLGVQAEVQTGDKFRAMLESQLDNRLTIWGVSK